MAEIFYTKGNKYIRGDGLTYSETLNKHKINLKKFSKKDLLYIFIESPTEIESEEISNDFGIDKKYFSKFKSDNRSSRYVLNPLVFSLTDYYIVDNRIHVARLLFIIKNNVVLMAVEQKIPYFKELFNKVITGLKRKNAKSETHILYEFLHQDIKENYEVIERMDDKIILLEKRIIDGNHSDGLILKEITGIKRELNKMNKRLWASSKVIFTIKKELSSLELSKEEISLLEDIYDTLMHQIDLIETQKENVTDFLGIFTTTISNRLASTSNELNMVMKKMAALTIILMVPTLIAGVYGTNFRNLPEVTWQYGYFYMLIAMAISVLITYYIFHRKRWI